MKLTKYGIKEWLGTGLIAWMLMAAIIYMYIIYGNALFILAGIFLGVVWLCIAAFFRDPKRTVPRDSTSIVSPADGVVKDIELVKDGDLGCFEGSDMLRIGIFLSVLDVHLNRAPTNMHIEFVQYKKGRFHDARKEEASQENESMTIAGRASVNGRKFPIAVRQISGAIARRIVCAAKIGDSLKKGEKYGMIKFGSRTELYLPASKDVEIIVKVGDRVAAGTSIVARATDTSWPTVEVDLDLGLENKN